MEPFECEEKQELLHEDDSYGSDNMPVFHRTWNRRNLPQRSHPLFKRVKAAAAISCICFLSYGLISLSNSELTPFPSEACL